MDLSDGRAALRAIADGGPPPRWSRAAVRAAVDAHPVTRRRDTTPDAALGTWDTPWREADALAAALAAAQPEVASWGDPCCGVGRLLVAAWDAWGAAEPEHRLQTLCAGDIDTDAVAVARDALACAVVASLTRAGADAARIARTALDRLDDAVAARDAVDTLAAMPRAAAVVTNPPFVSTRRLHRTRGAARVEALRAEHPECRGAFDLGVPIVARALDATADGWLGLVAPAAWQTADYAAPLRARLEARPWVAVTTDRRPFGAAVDVVVVASGPAGGTPFAWTPDVAMPGCVPLGNVADVWAGTPGFEARATADALVEGTAPGDVDGWPFVTSARVGAWALRDRAVRFMGTTWQRPVLPRASVASEARRLRYDRASWLVPGVASALRSAWCSRPTALGVGVLAVAPHDGLHALVGAALNAPGTTAAYRRMHPGAALSNGYVRLSVGLLSGVPVPDPSRADVQAALPMLREQVQRATAGDEAAATEATALVDRLRAG